MKSWNCQVKSKEEMTTDLMFEEIMKLRNESSELAAHVQELIQAINTEEETKSRFLIEKMENAKSFLQSLK